MKNECLNPHLIKKYSCLILAAITVLLASAAYIPQKEIVGTWRLLKSVNNGKNIPNTLTDRILEYKENGRFEGKIFLPNGVRKYNSGKYYPINDSTMVTFHDDITGKLSQFAYTYNFKIKNDTLHFYGYYLREIPDNKMMLYKVYLDEWWIKEPSLEENILQNHFNESDLKRLELLLEDFDKLICKYNCSADIQTAYSNFFTNILNSSKLEEIKPFSGSNLEMEEILQRVNNETFVKIWEYGTTSEPAIIPTTLNINYNGEFMSFLKEMSDKSDILKQYYDSIKTAGGINPFGFGLLRLKQKELNIQDQSVRLIIAIHYLTTFYGIK